MVKIRPVLYVLGSFLSATAVCMQIPLIAALVNGENTSSAFFISALITASAAAICMRMGEQKLNLQVRDMFVLTSATWVAVSLFAALPFTLYKDISYTDAVFETMSGITTTGSTVLTGLDTMAHSILLWRSLLQWIGGVGFIVMAVAILPFLNVGAMRLFRTESSDWSDKSTPRTKDIARRLFMVYLVLSVLCMICYNLAGMSWFDAVNHAMTTLSTGGFSTSDSSMSHFSPAAHWVGTVFMFAGGLPLLLFVQMISSRKIGVWNDCQVKGYLRLVVSVSVLLALWYWYTHEVSLLDALRLSSFNVVSVVTTTGYGLTDYGTWGPIAYVTFMALMLSGACSGSTSGGIKVFRFQIGFATVREYLKHRMHPRGVFNETYNKRVIDDDIIRSLIAFLLLYFGVILALTFFLVAVGVDPETSFSGAITAVSNVGPGMGPVIGPVGNFATLPESAKWALALGMLLGRLELVTVAVLFHRNFWRY